MPVKRATSFFEKVMFMICEDSGDFYVKARCYRSLRKSEDPHSLAIILKKIMLRQQFLEHIGLVKEEAVVIAIMFWHCCIN